MAFLKKRRNWKRIRPNDLRESFRLCKEHARERKNLSVERIAELMGVSADLLYKWLANAKMPASLIPLYEHICSIHFVTDYLNAANGQISIKIPTGKCSTPMELADLQMIASEAMRKLLRFYNGEADSGDTVNALTDLLEGVAWHRMNIEKMDQPELSFQEDAK